MNNDYTDLMCGSYQIDNDFMHKLIMNQQHEIDSLNSNLLSLQNELKIVDLSVELILGYFIIFKLIPWIVGYVPKKKGSISCLSLSL